MKKILRRILAAVLVLLMCVVGIITVIARKNVNAMHNCIDEAIEKISAGHILKELPAGDYANMKVYGIMNFLVKQYEIEELGNLSVMTVNVGLMQMATLVFTPVNKNLPLLSCDYMYILGNRKAYVELYDLVKEKDEAYMSWMEKYEEARNKFADLEDTTASEAWYDDLLTTVTYKAGKIADDDRLKGLLLDTVQVYLEQADAYETMNAEEKAEKLQIIKTYSDRLIDEGGISTSFFKKSLGEDITRDFFDKVFFGTELYR